MTLWGTVTGNRGSTEGDGDERGDPWGLQGCPSIDFPITERVVARGSWLVGVPAQTTTFVGKTD